MMRRMHCGDETPVDAPGDAEVVEVLRQLGIPAEAVERALERGDPEGAIFEAVLLPAIAERTVSAAEIEAAGGLPAVDIARMVEGFGFPPPDLAEPTFTPEEAATFTELGRLVVEGIWPTELGVQIARVYGRLLPRIAQAEMQLFRTYVESRLRAEEQDTMRGLRAVHSAFARLLPLADPLIMGVHRRWIEHELHQAAISEAESEAAGHPLPGAVEVAFLFCDLKDFTAYADREGDAAAIEAIDRFVDTVTRERGEDCRLMKLLGDGCMLSYGDAGSAVATGAGVIEAMRDSIPGVHASVHKGVAIAREGDYFGGAVNLAARLLVAADRDELLGTRPVVEESGEAFEWEPAGTRRIRGVRDPVDVFRLAR
jgi:class 3 adenylate cyclase